MDQLSLFTKERGNLLDLKEASIWASRYMGRKVTVSNISYFSNIIE